MIGNNTLNSSLASMWLRADMAKHYAETKQEYYDKQEDLYDLTVEIHNTQVAAEKEKSEQNWLAGAFGCAVGGTVGFVTGGVQGAVTGCSTGYSVGAGTSNYIYESNLQTTDLERELADLEEELADFDLEFDEDAHKYYDSNAEDYENTLKHEQRNLIDQFDYWMNEDFYAYDTGAWLVDMLAIGTNFSTSLVGQKIGQNMFGDIWDKKT